MHNARSGKRKAKATLLLEQGSAQKKLREEGADERAADTANDVHSGAEAVRVVAADEDGVDAATVEAEHRVLEARCERPTRITVAGVATGSVRAHTVAGESTEGTDNVHGSAAGGK